MMDGGSSAMTHRCWRHEEERSGYPVKRIRRATAGRCIFVELDVKPRRNCTWT